MNELDILRKEYNSWRDVYPYGNDMEAIMDEVWRRTKVIHRIKELIRERRVKANKTRA